MFSSAPKLARPVVDVEFRPLPASGGGVPISWELRPRELVVEARSRIPRRGGCNGDEVDDPRERPLSSEKGFIPGSAKDKDCLASEVFEGSLGILVGDSVFLLCKGTAAVASLPFGVTL